jgi:hypothetical protein
MNKLKNNGDKTIKHKNITSKLGVTDKNNHNVFYLECSSFITPNENFDDFTDIMSSIKKKCKQNLKENLLNNELLSRDFLINFDICSERMKENKSTYISIQYYFKQKNNLNKSILTIKKQHEDFFISILNKLESELLLNNITMSKKKKF